MGLSLQALAERSGISAAMLSDLENGRKSPTIRTLCLVAEGLGCSVSELVDEQEGRSSHVTRRADRPTVREGHSGITRELISPAHARTGIELLWYTIPAGTTTGPFPAHEQGVIETVLVVRGAALHTAGSTETRLAAGDAITYAADAEHEIRNVGRGGCEVLVVIDHRRT
jgi:transcriptional regulator with XRE-family HTH domain